MIAQYRKKPIVIEAEQFLGGWECLNLRGVCAKPECFMGGPHLHTSHADQKVVLEKGDWIIPEPDGVHFYPCKPDIFASTYEPGLDSENALHELPPPCGSECNQDPAGG